MRGIYCIYVYIAENDGSYTVLTHVRWYTQAGSTFTHVRFSWTQAGSDLLFKIPWAMLHFTVILHFTVCFYAGPFVFTQASLFLRRFCEACDFDAAREKTLCGEKSACSQRPLPAVFWSMVRGTREFLCADVQKCYTVCTFRRRLCCFWEVRKDVK